MAPNNTTPAPEANGANAAHGSHAPRPQASARPQVSNTPTSPASQVAPTQSDKLKLPPTVVTKADVSRCLREVQNIEDYFHQAAVRGSKDQQLPTTSKVLEGLANANGLNLIHAEDRSKLKEFLSVLKVKAPVVHMSFPSEASDAFLGKILDWFRSEAHPYTVLHVGLQPDIAAGFTMRTTNKAYDFSFRKRFEQSKQKLIEALEKADKDASEEFAQSNSKPESSSKTPQPTEAKG